MNNIGIYTNITKDIDNIITNRVKSWCKKNEIVYVEIEQNKNDEELYKLLDFIVVIGGDGTVLSISKIASKLGIKIVGINAGSLGYLTTIEIYEIETALDQIVLKQFKLIKHTMIETEINNVKYNALNEICIKTNNSKIIKVHLYINNRQISTYRGDGILVSTPTGSTAYNLSCGGPIILECANALGITPICAHSLSDKPLIIGSDSVIKFKIESQTKNVNILVDGYSIKKIDSIEITIRKSKQYLETINPYDKNFYEVLIDKLRNINI